MNSRALPKRSTTRKITHEECDRALREFLAKNGQIRHQAQEIAPRPRLALPRGAFGLESELLGYGPMVGGKLQLDLE